MSSRQVILVALVALLAAGPATAREASPALERLIEESSGELEIVFRKAPAVPTYVAGALPSRAGLAEETALVFLELHGDAFGMAETSSLVLDHVLAVGFGSVVRFHQELEGIPVELSSVAVRTDVEGRVRAVAVDVADLSAAVTEPVLAGPDAVALARHAALVLGMAHGAEPEADLVLLPLAGGEVRLAYKVRLGAVPELLSNPVVYVDALTGLRLLVVNAVRLDRQANVYLENPVTTPTVQIVTLTNLPDGFTTLTGTRTLARNCPDLHETTHIEFMGFPVDIHTCSEVQQATADTSGDFLYTPDETDPGDLFAEAMMYHAVEKAYEHYRSLGFDLLDEVPIPATVNFRTPINLYAPIDLGTLMGATDPHGPLYPFDNAMFVEAGNWFDFLTRDEDSMVFGQGTSGDFAYDGDVVTHEFGHAVVAATCRLGWYSLDPLGIDTSTGALNEAYADSGAFLDTLDSVVGDYAGSWLTGGGIRDVDCDNACPTDITGESHADSLMFTGALWDLVEAFPGDLAALEQAIFAAEISLGPASDFDEAAVATVSAIRDALGDTAASTAQTIFEARNVDDCVRVVDIEWGYPHATEIHLVQGGGMVAENSPFVPGPLQFHATAGMDYEQLVLSFRTIPDPMSMFFGGEIQPTILIKHGADPIAFEYSGSTVTGDWDKAVDAGTSDTGFFEVRLWLDGEGIPSGDYHLMFANPMDSGFIATQIRVLPTDDPYPRPDEEEPAAEEADEVEPVPDASEDVVDDGDDGDEDSGCGCRMVI